MPIGARVSTPDRALRYLSAVPAGQIAASALAVADGHGADTTPVAITDTVPSPT
jgi:hypothetical protein